MSGLLASGQLKGSGLCFISVTVVPIVLSVYIYVHTCMMHVACEYIYMHAAACEFENCFVLGG